MARESSRRPQYPHKDYAVDERPVALSFRPETVPEELRAIPAWVGWRFEPRKGYWTKIPVECRTGLPAKIDDSGYHATFDEAVEGWKSHRYDGVGLCRTDDQIFIDLDGCRNPDTGELASLPWVAELLRFTRGRAYLEVSPSGKGLHAIARGRLPPGRRQWDDPTGEHIGFALYDRTRYFAVTGHRLPESGCIIDLSEEINDLHAFLFGPTNSRTVQRNSSIDTDLVDRARNAVNGKKFQRLWAGEWSDNYPSHSEADLALCSMLAFWTGCDPTQIDRLFRCSGLMREKWERAEYRCETINRAIGGTLETRQLDADRDALSIIGPTSLRDGQPYCPFRLFNTVQIPIGIASTDSVSDTAKFVFGLRAFRTNRKDRTFVSTGRLAADLGVTIAAIQTADRQLEAAGLIRREPKANEVVFIWREVLRASLRRQGVAPMEGSPYSPHRLFLCFHVPMAVAHFSIGWVAKMLFGALERYAGPRSSLTNVDVATLARDLCVSPRTITRALNELLGHRLIRRTRGGDGHSATTEFTWRESLSASLVGHGTPKSVLSTLSQASDETNRNADTPQTHPQSRLPAGSDVTYVTGYKEEENLKREERRESSSRGGEAQTYASGILPASTHIVAGDDGPSDTLRSTIEHFVKTYGLTLRGPTTITEIAQLLRVSCRDTADISEFLEVYRRRWSAPPATWAHILVSLEKWLQEPAPQKGLEPHQALFALDVRRDTIMSLAEAVEIINSRQLESASRDEFSRAQVSDVFYVSLKEEGIKKISPRELLARQREFKANPPCERCKGEGVVNLPSGPESQMELIEWCHCVCAERLRKATPDFVESNNKVAEDLARPLKLTQRREPN